MKTHRSIIFAATFLILGGIYLWVAEPERRPADPAATVAAGDSGGGSEGQMSIKPGSHRIFR